MQSFANIKKQMQQLSYIKKTVVSKLEQLKHIYNEMVKSNNTKKIFLICLASFHFQYKVLNVELDSLNRLYLLLTNRTFYDYSCTYALLQKHYVEYGIQVPTIMMHKPYKDLEPFAEYELEDIYLAHSNMVELLQGLKTRFNNSEASIAMYKDKMKAGLHISSFINTLVYDNNVLHDQITLYESYIAFYYESQCKYFDELLSKMKMFLARIDAEIVLPNNALISEDDTVAQMSDDACIVQELYESAEHKVVPSIPLQETQNNKEGAGGVSRPSVGGNVVPSIPLEHVVLEISQEASIKDTSSSSDTSSVASDTPAKKPRKKRVKNPDLI